MECGGALIECDDDNPCTDDLCSPADGCLHVPQDGVPCDDDVACTTDDVCLGGVCAGNDSECTCSPTFYDAAKATDIAMGATGYAGDGRLRPRRALGRTQARGWSPNRDQHGPSAEAAVT